MVVKRCSGSLQPCNNLPVVCLGDDGAVTFSATLAIPDRIVWAYT
jgi:hypothetical protein